MREVFRVFFTRYPSGGDRTDAEVVFNTFLSRSEFEAQKEALNERYEAMRLEEAASAIVNEAIEKLPVGVPQSDHRMTGEVVYQNANSFHRDRSARLRAAHRLCCLLESRDPGYRYHYRGRIEILPDGFIYNFNLSIHAYMEEDDKKRYVKRKVAGSKAAISRALNQAKAIRSQYRKSLFPDYYREDPEYKRHMRSIPLKRARLQMVRCIDPLSLPDLKDDADRAIVALRERSAA